MINELIQKLNISMKAVQNLQIQPTEHNCQKILTALAGIREAADVAREMNQRLAELEKATAAADEPDAAAETDAGAEQAAAEPAAETDAGTDQAAAEPAAETDAGADQAAAEPDEFEDRER